ncbi:hypothetical protein ACFWBR_43150 [Streptomyces sp. NPDC060006]|uniref:oxidoreductase n=1 Tax=unclassified Streptomyces TaxID=2593676 RepID=UPI0036B214EF
MRSTVGLPPSSSDTGADPPAATARARAKGRSPARRGRKGGDHHEPDPRGHLLREPGRPAAPPHPRITWLATRLLLHQFLSDDTNQHTDGYGSSAEGRIRFAAEVAATVADEIGAERTGIRISPANPYNDIAESDTTELYPALLETLRPLGLAYL